MWIMWISLCIVNFPIFSDVNISVEKIKTYLHVEKFSVEK